MSVIHSAHKTEIFKFKETGLLPLFYEVIRFIDEQHANYGVNWTPVDIRQDDTSWYVEMRDDDELHL